MSDSQDEVSAIPLDKLAKVYRKMQARIQELTTEYENQIEGIKAQRDEVKSVLKDRMLALGVKSVKTDHGTVSLTTKTRYNASDWDAFKEFVKEHDALDLFERRIAQTNMAKFLEENPKLLPPGLNSHSEFDISVRKPT
jgi:uncharacterized lipoprotein